jgi:hypothetical protein
MNKQYYVGSELELFSQASNWKNYYSNLVQNYVGSNVLEVGAGIGSTTSYLCQGKHSSWVCLEPDLVLANQIQTAIIMGHLPEYCKVQIGTLADLSHNETFNTIIYIDVLEHIKDDAAEVRLATKHLRDGGTLIVLAPAHQWLFTPFDEAIGHYRRYDKTTLAAIIPENLKCIKLNYIDSVGLIATLGNRFILKSKIPNKKQIMVWDKLMIPISRIIDPAIQYLIGKSIIGIWQNY